MISNRNRKGNKMTKPDPFGFDMSVSSAKKKATRTRRGMSGASDTSTRECEHEGCSEPGKDYNEKVIGTGEPVVEKNWVTMR